MLSTFLSLDLILLPKNRVTFPSLGSCNVPSLGPCGFSSLYFFPSLDPFVTFPNRCRTRASFHQCAKRADDGFAHAYCSHAVHEASDLRWRMGGYKRCSLEADKDDEPDHDEHNQLSHHLHDHAVLNVGLCVPAMRFGVRTLQIDPSVPLP